MNTFILLILVLLFDLILVNLDTNLIRNLSFENIHFTETDNHFTKILFTSLKLDLELYLGLNLKYSF